MHRNQRHLKPIRRPQANKISPAAPRSIVLILIGWKSFHKDFDRDHALWLDADNRKPTCRLLRLLVQLWPWINLCTLGPLYFCTSVLLHFCTFLLLVSTKKNQENGSEEGYHVRDRSPYFYFDNGHRVHVARINWNSQVFAHNKLWAERFPSKIFSQYAGRKSRIEFSCYWKEVCVQAATDFSFWFWRGCSHHRKRAWADLIFSQCWIVYCAFCQHFKKNTTSRWQPGKII